MSTFFLRLAQRTLGQGELVRPLAPSRYATATGGAPEEIVSERRGRTDRQDDPAAAAPPGSFDERIQSTKSATPAVLTTPAIHLAQAATNEPETHHQDHEPDGKQATGRTPSSEPIEAKAVPARADMTSTDQSRGRPRTHQEGPQTPTDAPAPSRTPADRFQKGLVRRPAQPDTAIERLDLNETVVPTRAPDRPLRPAAMAESLAPTAAPDEGPPSARTRRDRIDPAPPTPAAEPVIEVHIGRIEVHAAERTAAAVPEGPQSPGLSLANYLERRNGGRR